MTEQIEEGYVAVDPLTVDPDVMWDALWRIASGSWKQEAAVLLLSFHDHWMKRPAFRRRVRVSHEIGDPAGPMWAEVDWTGLGADIAAPYDDEAAGDQVRVASSRELRILSLAVSIGGGGQVDLSDTLDAGFDNTNAQLVQAAVVHAMRGFGSAASPGAAALWPVRP